MRFTAAAALLAIASSASASVLNVRNQCSESIYLTATNQQGQITSQNELTSGNAVVNTISGNGNSLALSKNTDFYSPDTAKLVLGTSTDGTTLYWSVSAVNGNPFTNGENFSVTSPGPNGNAEACGSANSPDGQTHGCPDNGVMLTLTACS